MCSSAFTFSVCCSWTFLSLCWVPLILAIQHGSCAATAASAAKDLSGATASNECGSATRRDGYRDTLQDQRIRTFGI